MGLAFDAGLGVMVMELAGARLMAPADVDPRGRPAPGVAGRGPDAPPP